MASAAALDLSVDDAVVVHNSNRLAVRLLPCEVLARVAPAEAQTGAEFEILLAQRLAETDSPVAALEPRVEPRVYLRDGFAVTLWTYYRAVPPGDFAPAEYAEALQRLHAGMRQVAVKVPHFTERVTEAQRLVGHAEMTPALLGPDRDLLMDTLQRFTGAVVSRGAGEQLLHGEPHPGNLLRTKNGLLFVDLETLCRGPVELDVAHAPEEVGQAYPAADQDLLRECRVLSLAVAATWRYAISRSRDSGMPWLNNMGPSSALGIQIDPQARPIIGGAAQI
jgi:hypothetical protein